MSTITMSDFVSNYRDLCGITAHCVVGHNSVSLRGHLDATRAIEIDVATYGPFTDAAAIIKESTVDVLARLLESTQEAERALLARRVKWSAKLEEFEKAIVIDEEDLTPENGPALLKALRGLESGEVTEDLYGDLLPEAQRVRERGIANYKEGLKKIAFKIIDPDHMPDLGKASAASLEYALASFRELPLGGEDFLFTEEDIPRARAMHAASVKKLEAIVAEAKEREAKDVEGHIERAREHLDESEHRHRVDEASLTAEQRGARHARMVDAVEHLYKVAQRITEIAVLDEENHVGTISADGLLELAQQAQVLVMRVEGRLN